jgi:hypothetical protein
MKISGAVATWVNGVVAAITATGMAVDPELMHSIINSKSGTWVVAAYAALNTFLHAFTGPGPAVKS